MGYCLKTRIIPNAAEGFVIVFKAKEFVKHTQWEILRDGKIRC